MLKMRVYVDTSVIGGCFDEKFSEDSLRLFDEFAKGIKTLTVSDVLLFELEKAPDEVKDILKKVPEENIEYISLSEESIALANAYIREGTVTEGSISDARHIAIATVARVDVLVSWNFKHIVNISRVRQLNSVNLKLGYPILEIRSPKEVFS